MKPICIKDSEQSPAIYMDLDNCRLIITGISVMADPRSTYNKLISVIKKYAIKPASSANISIMLQETNSQSILFLLEVLRLIVATNEKNSIHIDWLYDSKDIDLKENIEVIEEILAIQINKVPYLKMDWTRTRNISKTLAAVSVFN